MHHHDASLDLTGTTALVTGGNQGIGWSIAEALASSGARVVINYPDADRFPARLPELGADALSVQADVGKLDQIETMLAQLDGMGVTVDVLVNNAGIYPRAEVLDLDEATWDAVHDVNLKGTFFCAQAAARRMVQRGRGNIINIASVSALIPAEMGAHYCASKAGVVAVTKSLALALARHGIRVNAIAPGLTDTAQPRYGMSEEEMVNYAQNSIPMGRMAQPDDIAAAALFLVSDLSRFVTGQTIFVNGGSLMMP
ncbi:MAG: SDR family NAD(P)-dependent oxidoreductase [Thermomicrobiales bacterium]